MGTRAWMLADGSWSLTGAKMWITNGAVSDTELGDAFLVYARTGGPDDEAVEGEALFLVEKGTSASPLASASRTSAACARPRSVSLLDRPRRRAWWATRAAHHCMMRNLEIERVVLAAMAVGLAHR